MNAPTHDIASEYGLRKSGSRFVGPCPQCGGSNGSDKFVLFADGGFRCFGCGWKGDRIKWLREMEQMSCRQAHDVSGKDCSPSCPNYGPCRNGEQVKRRPRSVRPMEGKAHGSLAALNPTNPTNAWSTWAMELVTKAKAALAKEPDEIQWLASRGIDGAQVDRFRLGWLGHDMRVDKRSLGLPIEGDKDRLWVPGGLVIPIYAADGQLHRLRIRRTPAARDRFLQDRKYVWIKGSGNLPMVLRPSSQVRGAVIVEAELDAIAVAAAHPDVLVVALGTVSGGVDAAMGAELSRCPVILVALDADQTVDGKLGAGPAAVKRWRATYSQSRFWPMPKGKDPGDFVRDHAGDLRAWVESGLPSVVSAQEDVQDQSFSPAQCDGGERGILSSLSPEAEAEQGKHYVLTVLGGQEIHVVDRRQLWEQLTAEGKTVFSENELQRLRAALVGLDADGRAQALQAAMDAKAIFPSAYIRRGEVLQETTI